MSLAESRTEGRASDRVAELEAELTAALARVEALRAALRRHGQHDLACCESRRVDCFCGLDTARGAL